MKSPVSSFVVSFLLTLLICSVVRCTQISKAVGSHGAVQGLEAGAQFQAQEVEDDPTETDDEEETDAVIG